MCGDDIYCIEKWKYFKGPAWEKLDAIVYFCILHPLRCLVRLPRSLQYVWRKFHSWNLCYLPWKTSDHCKRLLWPGNFRHLRIFRSYKTSRSRFRFAWLLNADHWHGSAHRLHSGYRGSLQQPHPPRTGGLHCGLCGSGHWTVHGLQLWLCR